VTGRQGTAARSPQRTVGSGDARGRPYPVQMVAQSAAHPARCKRGRSRSASPHCQRSIPLVRPLCAGSATFPARRTPPGAAPRHRRCPDVGAERQGPRGSRSAGPLARASVLPSVLPRFPPRASSDEQRCHCADTKPIDHARTGRVARPGDHGYISLSSGSPPRAWRRARGPRTLRGALRSLPGRQPPAFSSLAICASSSTLGTSVLPVPVTFME
jgi:hypothetical protein